MTKVWLGIRKHGEHLRRLAVVFAVPIRIKIVTELYQREMSPKQFYEAFGGSSLSGVAKHFSRLRETGWLRQIRAEGPGGKRRGGVETVHRATELAFCDRETWAILPYSIRVTVTWSSFKEIAERLREAMEAHLFAARPDRLFKAKRLLLDQEGSERVAEAVAQEFAGQYEEQEDARRRADHNDAELFPVGSLLIAAEMPAQDGIRLGPELVPIKPPLAPVPVRLSKAFADELCMQIIKEANDGPTSAPMVFAKYGKRFGLKKAWIGRRFTKMVQAGWLTQVGERTGGGRRGGVEKLYRATGPALYDEAENAAWTNPSADLADTADWATFVQLSEWVKSAMLAGTFNRRDDMCIAWSILSLDQQGWENVTASLRRLLDFIRQEEKLARARLKESGDKPTPMVLGLGAFETLPLAREI
jgi:hypothetical protein